MALVFDMEKVKRRDRGLGGCTEESHVARFSPEICFMMARNQTGHTERGGVGLAGVGGDETGLSVQVLDRRLRMEEMNADERPCGDTADGEARPRGTAAGLLVPTSARGSTAALAIRAMVVTSLAVERRDRPVTAGEEGGGGPGTRWVVQAVSRAAL